MLDLYGVIQTGPSGYTALGIRTVGSPSMSVDESRSRDETARCHSFIVSAPACTSESRCSKSPSDVWRAA